MPLDFKDIPWNITDDPVMGGRSSSEFETQAEGLEFSGTLSLENNGGFVSVLGTLEHPPNPIWAIRLTISGDGRRYQLRLRENRDSRSVAWRAFFRANEQSSQITLTRKDFQPVIRGQSVLGAKPLEEAKIRHLGFLLNDGQEGEFRLNVHNIEFLPERKLGGRRLVIGASRGIGLGLVSAQLDSPEIETVIATSPMETATVRATAIVVARLEIATATRAVDSLEIKAASNATETMRTAKVVTSAVVVAARVADAALRVLKAKMPRCLTATVSHRVPSR